MTTTCPTSRRVVWVGPSNGNFSWLLNRIAELGPIELIERSEITAESLASVLDQRIDRILFGTENRIDFPLKTLQKLSILAPEIPAAVVTGNWWNGARRTGLLPRHHLIQPWHRWWDVWSDWIEGTNPKLFGPDIGPSNHLIHRTDDHLVRFNQRLLIVCDSLNNALTWQRLWNVHVESKWLRSHDWETIDSHQPSIILYDLDDMANGEEFWSGHRARLSEAHHLFVSSIPESQWVTQFQQGSDFGQAENGRGLVLLASKPLGPRGIIRILNHVPSTQRDRSEPNVTLKTNDR